MNKKTLTCKILLKYLNDLGTSPYVDNNTRKLVNSVLKADWFVWDIEGGLITKLKSAMVHRYE